MTTTSFNPIQGQPSTIQQSQPLTIKQGQVFHGTIKKLFPDDMVEIQVGKHKMFAKLEIPLKTGESHFFQVTRANPQIELKVVSSQLPNQSSNGQLNQLIESMNLPKTNELRQLLGYFIKHQIPILKDQLLKAEQWIKGLNTIQRKEAFLALQRMAEGKMPFTSTVFHALIYGGKTQGIMEDLEQFQTVFKNAQNIPSQLKQEVTTMIQKITTPLEGEMGGILLKRAVQTLLNGVGTDRQEMLQLLKDANILPKEANIQNWQSMNLLKHQNQPINQQNIQTSGQLLQGILNIKSDDFATFIQQAKTLIQKQPISQLQKEEWMQLIDQTQNIHGQKQSIETFVRNFQENLLTMYSSNTLKSNTKQIETMQTNILPKEHLISLLKPDSNQQTFHEQLLNIVKIAQNSDDTFIRSEWNQIENEIQSSIDGKMFNIVIKNILKGIGLNYEATLNHTKDVESLLHTLKPQLLSLIQDANVPQSIKAATEPLLARMNGMQLLSGEQGHQHQIIMQIPLQLLGRKIDTTIQWNGRMKENGKIDANFARILFYLNMESLQETVVDMQVQNRIVTLHLYNNLNLEELSEPLQQRLKEGLAKHHYHLSGIVFKPLIQSSNHPKLLTKEHEKSKQSGVDIRI